MRLSARSIQARTRSPGMAPRTSTTWPRWRAIIRPPDAGFSIVSSTCCPSNRLTATRFQLPAASFQLPASSYQLPVTSYRLPPTAYRLPPTAYRQLRIMREHREADRVAEQAVERRVDGAGARVGGHARGERGDLGLRLGPQRRDASGVEIRAGGVEQLAVERAETIDHRGAGLAARVRRGRARAIELADGLVESAIELERAAAAPHHRQPRDRPIDMGRP